MTTCKELNINIFTYGPLAQGFLTGKYKEGATFGNDDCRKRLSHFHEDKFKQKSNVIKKLSEISERYNVSMSQVALRWVLENSYVSCAISGIKSITQIEDNTASLEFEINPDDYNFFYGRS